MDTDPMLKYVQKTMTAYQDSERAMLKLAIACTEFQCS